MKKILSVLIVLLILTGCTSKDSINYTYDIVSKDVDMSGYDGVNSTDHMFKGVKVTELFNCIDNKSSAVFYLGRTNCACCQTCIQYLNQAAKELGVTIYYLDVYDEEMPITDQDLCNQLKLYLFNILDTDETGQRVLQTPTVFSVVNGELVDSIICLSNYNWDNPPTDSQINRLLNKYKEILKPFVK